MYKKVFFAALALSQIGQVNAQDPAITSWLINTTGITGRHYIEGVETPIADEYPANVQTVSYSDDYSYVECSGIPSYIIGPYLDGNPAQGTDNEWIFQIPLNKVFKAILN